MGEGLPQQSDSYLMGFAMNHELEEYNAAIVSRAKIQARLCCDPTCEGCSWFDECQGSVDKAEQALLKVLAD